MLWSGGHFVCFLILDQSDIDDEHIKSHTIDILLSTVAGSTNIYITFLVLYSTVYQDLEQSFFEPIASLLGSLAAIHWSMDDIISNKSNG